jgi:uncharacterized protein with PIN domain
MTDKINKTKDVSNIKTKTKKRKLSRHHEIWRCDHCGQFVGEYQLYTLFDMVNRHEHEEDVSVCAKCSGSVVKGVYTQKYTPEYWSQWLNKRFAPVESNDLL